MTDADLLLVRRVLEDTDPSTADVEHARMVLDALVLERDGLLLQLNTPHVVDFLEAVRIEAAHQRERWGAEHDARKDMEDWVALAVRLLGKVVNTHWEGDRQKHLHHIITLAAVCANWHANATGADTRMRSGIADEQAGAA